MTNDTDISKLAAEIAESLLVDLMNRGYLAEAEDLEIEESIREDWPKLVKHVLLGRGGDNA